MKLRAIPSNFVDVGLQFSPFGMRCTVDTSHFTPQSRNALSFTRARARAQIDDFMRDFRLTDETYERIMDLLDAEMRRGLGASTHRASTVRMFPTYVRSIPDGSGKGCWLLRRCEGVPSLRERAAGVLHASCGWPLHERRQCCVAA